MNLPRVRSFGNLLIWIGVGQLILLIIYYIYSELKDLSPSSTTKVWNLVPGIPGERTRKWILVHEIIPQNPIEEQLIGTFLILQRSLVLFSIREVNLRIKDKGCTRWWANPLSVKEVYEETITSATKKFTLVFEVQPGRIPFETVVLVHKNRPNATHPYVSDDLVFVSARRLDGNGKCSRDLGEDVRNLCLCPEEVEEAEENTRRVRELWNVDDPEHPDWPPNATMTVPDFLTLGRMDIYLKTPDTTKLDYCGSHVKMVLFISSAPTHGEQRNMIRKTYGDLEYLRKQGVRLLFSFAKFLDPVTQVEVDAEIREYADILQSDFIDHYQNQSLGELFVYNWLVTHCGERKSPMPPWLLKADDDSFLNIPLALRVAASNPTAEIMGCQSCPHPVQRLGKAQVPKYMYAPKHWFGFGFGGAALISTDILPGLLKASLTCPIVNLCDVYITGILAKQIGVRPLNSPLFQTSLIVRENTCSRTRYMVNTHADRKEQIMSNWESLRQPPMGDCTFDESLLIADPVTPQKRIDCFYD